MEYFTAEVCAIRTYVTRSVFHFPFKITRLTRKRNKIKNVRSEI